jgi:hypothetical protein
VRSTLTLALPGCKVFAKPAAHDLLDLLQLFHAGKWEVCLSRIVAR